MNINLALERFWLVVVFLVALFCGYEFWVDGPEIAKWYLIALVLPIFMWLFRMFLRIRMEKTEEKAKSKKK